MKRNICMLCLTLLLVSFIMSGCGVKPEQLIDSRSVSEDYNTTTYSWLSSQIPVVVTEQGIYSLDGNYIMYTDQATRATKPLCFQVNCAHEKESDSMKIPDCDAFVGSDINYGFLGASNDRLIVRAHNTHTDQFQIITMKLDGSGRKTLIADTKFMDVNTLRVHRGQLIYAETSWEDGNKKELKLCKTQIDSGKTEVLASFPDAGNAYVINVLPYEDNVFFCICKDQYTDGKTEYLSSLYQCDLKEGTLKVISDEPYSPYGILDGKLLVGKNLVYSLIDCETGEITEDVDRISVFQNEHQGWQCHPDCIQDDFMMFTCYDKEITDDFVPDLYICNGGGEVTAVIQDEAWTMDGVGVFRIGGEEYLLKVAAKPRRDGEPQLLAYKKQDLLNGKVSPVCLVEWKDDLNKVYGYSKDGISKW